jgi:hypothetical protein
MSVSEPNIRPPVPGLVAIPASTYPRRTLGIPSSLTPSLHCSLVSDTPIHKNDRTHSETEKTCHVSIAKTR